MQPVNSLQERDSSIPRWQQLLTESGLLEQISHGFPSGQNVVSGTPSSKNTVIQQGLACLTKAAQVVELRVLGINGKKRTDSGYFDNPEKLAKAAASYDGRAEGIYFTLNPVNPALTARANNRVKQYAEHTTSDNDILKRINLPIDFDPVRPAGISSTDDEQQAALIRAWACRLWLSAQGWPEPVFASSGNGAHLIYALDLPNNGETSELIKGCLNALSSLFSDSSVKVDTSTGNASRIFKLYGTLACKGDPTPERPHRRAAILAAPESRQVASHELLTVLASQAPVPKLQIPQSHSKSSASLSTAYGRAALDREITTLSATTDGNRNNQLFQSAASLFSLVASHALDRTEVWNALLSTALSIGLSEIEARRTIGSGEKRGTGHPRLVPPTRGSEATNNQQSDGAQNLPKPAIGTTVQHLMHADELDNLPPIQWLIQDILPANNLVEVHGAPGAGKTQVVFDMAQTLAATGQTVIYVVAEGLQGYRGRKRAWQKFHKLGSGNLYLWNQAVHLFDAASVQSFLQVIQPKKPNLIVFDTLSRCSLGADENSQKDMNFILEALDKVRRETGATIVAVHHTNAAGARERGSTVIRGGMDVMLEVSKDDELIIMSCSKMKDAADFESLYLKPVLVDIGEEKPVPVLVPAEKRVQTQADKLTPLQFDILKAIGMEMFAESGIKSSQLDEILPPTTKRASKYYGLNTLIRLGYVKPHAKGDPYHMTDEGRQKLSNTESRAISGKSSMSKASPGLFIWNLPEACPMSSQVPHTYQCGTDATLDSRQDSHAAALEMQPTRSAGTDSPTGLSQQSDQLSNGPDTVVKHSDDEGTAPGSAPMTAEQLAHYAKRAGVPYPTTNGPDLYRMSAVISKARRDSFESSLGDAVSAYFDEVARQGHEPPEPAPDPVESFVRSGLLSAEELFTGYKRARDTGQGAEFVATLKKRNSKAAELLLAWINGKRDNTTAYIPRSM